jgi:hypothetical protein
VAVLPCVGTGPKTFDVTEAMIAGWRPAFPGVDVRAEVHKAAAWAAARPTRRKTHRGTPAFLVGWLSRAQDRGGRPLQHQAIAPAAPASDFGEGGEREIPA